jgi:hypothetical protein
LVEILALSGILPTRTDLLHALALPPLDLTFDVGTLLGRATGPLWFALGLVGCIAARATILCLMLGSWRRWWFALRFELVVLVPSFLAAELAYSGQAILYSAIFWIGMAVATGVTLLAAHVPWSGTRSVLSTLGRGLLEGPRLPTVVTYLAALGVLTILVGHGGRAGALIGVAVSAALTLATARRLSKPAVAHNATRLGALILVGLAVALILATSTGVRPSSGRRAGELVVVAGIDTSSGHGSLFSLRPSSLGFSCAQTFYYSYVGPGRGSRQAQAACPITTGSHYTRADTERSLGLLVRAFRAQVDHLTPPVTVVAHSSGALVAWAAVSSDPGTPVRRIVMLAPMSDPLGYPPPGTSGRGTVGAAAMRFLVALGNWDGFTRFNPDSPLARELLAPSNAIPALFGRALPPQVRALAIPSAYDVALFTGSRPFALADASCAPFESHGALATSEQTLAQADRFLSGQPLEGCTAWARWAASAAAGFQVP